MIWEEGPSGELVIQQNLLVPKESHVVSEGCSEKGSSVTHGLFPICEAKSRTMCLSFHYLQRILIGQKGLLISQIAQEVGRDLMDIFHCDVLIRLSVKLLK